MPTRVLLVGLDGATFDIINPGIAAGKFPALAALTASGAAVPLTSTLPPVTFPAWSTILTGKSPASHGLVDFTLLDLPEKKLRFASASDRDGATISRLVTEAGGKAACIGFPTTYPIDKKSGIVVSGFDSPLPKGLGRDFVFPEDGLVDAEKECGPYLTTDLDETSKRGIWHRKALERMLLTATRRGDIASHLLRGNDWDLFAVHFGESDTCSHHFWAICDEKSPRHHSELHRQFGNALELVYKNLDKCLGKLVKAAGPDVTVCVVSDHGFGGAGDRVIYLNRALEDAGLCQLKKAGIFSEAGNIAKWAGLHLLPGVVQSTIFRTFGSLPATVEAGARFGPIDFPNSSCWSEELPYFPSVRLNLHGRDPDGLVTPEQVDSVIERIIACLQTLIDPLDGEKVFERVARREELYTGPYLERYPEIICLPRHPGGYSYHFGKSSSAKSWFKQMSPKEYLGVKGGSMNGSHRPEGVLLLAGPEIGKGKSIPANAQDVTPTLLHLLGLPVRSLMDGRVLTECLKGKAKNRKVSVVESPEGQGIEIAGSGERDAEVARQLKSLGYL